MSRNVTTTPDGRDDGSSIVLAVYSIVAEQSLPKLFAAALIPGIVLAVLYVATVAVTAQLRPGLRTMGTGLPGYRAGWFRLRNGEKALLYLTELLNKQCS